jgi:hypothetical protein
LKKQTLPKLKKECWKLFSEWVRRKDADETGTVECYTCRKPIHWKEAHAGHFVPGRTGSVLLNPAIVRPQCVQCNIFLCGNYSAYTLRMLDEVGREKVQEYLALKHVAKKWTRAELEGIRYHYRAELEKLPR